MFMMVKRQPQKLEPGGVVDGSVYLRMRGLFGWILKGGLKLLCVKEMMIKRLKGGGGGGI